MVIKVERRKLSKNEVSRSISRLKSNLITAGFPVADIVLFGSYAKGLASIDSDIDVAVVLRHPVAKDIKDRINELHWIAKQTNVKFEVHLLTDEEMNNKYLSLVGEIKKPN